MSCSSSHKDFFKTTESRKCCPDCGKMIIVHFRTDKQKKQFNKKDSSWPDAWSFDYNHGEDTHRFLFFDGSEKQKWIEDNLSFNDPSIFGVEQKAEPAKDPIGSAEPIDVLNRFIRITDLN